MSFVPCRVPFLQKHKQVKDVALRAVLNSSISTFVNALMPSSLPRPSLRLDVSSIAAPPEFFDHIRPAPEPLVTHVGRNVHGHQPDLFELIQFGAAG